MKMFAAQVCRVLCRRCHVCCMFLSTYLKNGVTIGDTICDMILTCYYSLVSPIVTPFLTCLLYMFLLKPSPSIEPSLARCWVSWLLETVIKYLLPRVILAAAYYWWINLRMPHSPIRCSARMWHLIKRCQVDTLPDWYDPAKRARHPKKSTTNIQTRISFRNKRQVGSEALCAIWKQRWPHLESK